MTDHIEKSTSSGVSGLVIGDGPRLSCVFRRVFVPWNLRMLSSANRKQILNDINWHILSLSCVCLCVCLTDSLIRT